MRKILFVDDDQLTLEILRKMLSGMCGEWDIHFTDNGPEALLLLTESDFEVIVSDMRMPEMDGTELLKKVREKHPDMVRIILSAFSDHKAIMRTVRLAHQYIS